MQVKACVQSNVRVHPVPGASAVITALVASGLPTDEFTFGEWRSLLVCFSAEIWNMFQCLNVNESLKVSCPAQA